MAKYIENEQTAPYDLCLPDGKLNRANLGWARNPIINCNLNNASKRKKKWNFWLILNENFGFSATVADVEFMGLGSVWFLDFATRESYDYATVTSARSMKMPRHVEEDVAIKNPDLRIEFDYTDGGLYIRADCPNMRDGKLKADIFLSKPAGHETLNTTIPWNDNEFHFTSKQNTLPATGKITHGDKTYEFKPENSFGVLDFGRGIWPKEFQWNWSVFNHRQDGDLIGINLGGKWTDGTGANENGICLNGILYKVMEDVKFSYDTSDYMKPWTMKTELSDMVDLTLTPIHDKAGGVNSGPIKAEVHQCFGRINGTLRPGGKTLNIKNAFGWAEYHIGAW